MPELLAPPQANGFLRRTLRAFVEWLRDVKSNAGHSGTDNIVSNTLRQGRRRRGGRVA